MAAPIDRTGYVSGRLTVVRLDSNPYRAPSGGRYRRWLCQCSCGNPELVSVSGPNLTAKRSKSCGCLRREKCAWLGKYRVHRRGGEGRYNLRGRRFGRLKVLGDADPSVNEWEQAVYLCQCDCGSPPKAIVGASLRHGHTKSCGCLRRENMKRVSDTYRDRT